jgi:8-oxo-dGTP pyrophosphatase MutT (NUDIX family)
MSTARRKVWLAEALAAFEPSDADEQRHKNSMLSLLEHGEPAFGREHYAPGHFTASAFITNPARDAFLLILHKKLGLWLQPGGHVELDDPDLAAAARRELIEEVGAANPLSLGGIFDLDVHPIPARKDEPGHAHYDVRFLFELTPGSEAPTSEVAGARWVPFTELDTVHTDASVRRAAAKVSRGA